MSPVELWERVVSGTDLTSTVPKDRWGIAPADVLCDPENDSTDRIWSDRGGYVSGFDDVFDATGFGLPADEITGLDPVFQWTFHTAREALRDAGYGEHDAARFGHDEVVSFLLANGACAHIRNARGQDARAVAVAYAKEQTAALLGGGAAGTAAAGPAGSQQVRAGRVSGATAPNVNAIKSDIRRAVINQKASECAPCVVRWHAGPLRAWAHSAAAMRPPS